MRILRKLFGARGKSGRPAAFELAPELDEFDRETIRIARPFTMTSLQRLQALILATRHVIRRNVPGAIVECGVWRGGSMLTAARTLLKSGSAGRHLYLYDTYAGMPAAEQMDVRRVDGMAAATLLADPTEEQTRAIAPLSVVKEAMGLSGYASALTHYVVGPVEETIPATDPGPIALLRLDTDWYSSTRHELEHLYPRLSPGGVLIIDDYGYWDGARRAVDEYFANHELAPLLNVIDDTGRIGIKA